MAFYARDGPLLFTLASDLRGALFREGTYGNAVFCRWLMPGQQWSRSGIKKAYPNLEGDG